MSRESQLVRVLEGVSVLVTVLVLPVALYVTQRGQHAALVYLVANTLLATGLVARRSPWYAGQCVLLFCFTALVRRLIDLQAGWNPSNPVLLTPYLCSLLAVVGFFRYWLQRNPRYIGRVLCLLLCIAYGVVLAMFAGRVNAALVDAIKWSVGPIFAVYVLSEADRHESLRGVVEPCLVWSGAIMGIYGVVQYVLMPAWDAEWMRNVMDLGMTSIGQPEPFQARVFSTMNSPASLGIMLIAGLVLALKRGVGVASLTVPPMLAALALCQYRSIWAATAIAVALVAVPRRAGLPRTNIVALAAVGVIALTVVVADPRIREPLALRVSSLSTLQTDDSLRTRLAEYGDLTRNDHLVFGEGLAINGASLRLDKGRVEVIDGALIETLRGLGVVVGSVFLLTVAGLAGALLFMPPSAGRQSYYDRAIVLSVLVQLPMSNVFTGELGFCAWIFLGFGLSALIAHEVRQRARAELPSCELADA